MGPTPLCTRHYRPAEAACEGCGGGLCAECRGSGPKAHVLCGRCIQAGDEAQHAAESLRADRFALRRAGYAVGRRPGDPIVLWSGPLRFVLPAGGSTLLVIAGGTAIAAGQLRAGLDVAIGGLAFSLIAGQAVRRLFGGVSQVAGLCAALVSTAALLFARSLLGDGRTVAGAPLAGFRRHTDDLFASPWIPLGCLVTSIAIAYAGSAGRRAASLWPGRRAR